MLDHIEKRYVIYYHQFTSRIEVAEMDEERERYFNTEWNRHTALLIERNGLNLLIFV